MLLGSTFLLFLAAFLSIRFVRLQRLGRPWLLVSLALLLMGGLRLFTLFAGIGETGTWMLDPTLETITLGISVLLASGFALTERWFLLKERLEGRFGLITEVDRQLIGVLEEERILSIVCEVLSRRKGYRLAWIAAGEPDGSVRVVKHAGEGDGFPAGAGIRWDDSPGGRGPTGIALRTGVPCVVNRVGEDPRMAPWGKVLSGIGIRSAASVRIEPNGQHPFALTVYADSRSEFDRVEMQSISALAHRIGVAIQSARRHVFFVCAKAAYDDLLKNQRDGVILVRGEKIVRANPAAAAMLGFPETENLFGRDPAMILENPERDPMLREFLRSGGDAGGGHLSEAGIVRSDGSAFTGEISINWLPRESGKAMWTPRLTGPLGMIILRDISEKTRLERQIIEMQKMEAVGTLAGGIAHDFNNILTGILGNLDLAQNAIPPASPAWMPVKESIRASERAAHMVRQLLDFSRRSPSTRKSLDLRKVTREVADLFSQTIDKRIGVETVSDDEIWLASADPNQMHQVVMNLCVNARDAIMERLEGRSVPGIPEGGFRIRLIVRNASVGEDYCRKYPYARRGEFVVVSISDNGAGMDEATRQRIFEPFFTTKKLGRGTGLGLSTVYGIIKQHEGWINLESRPGEGTTFRTYLPRADMGAEEESQGPEATRPKPGKETILLVDDEEIIRSVCQQILELQGYSVITASDGQEAIDLYLRERERIDIVILDMTMPSMSGADVLTRIRTLNPHARVILSSGYQTGEHHLASAFLPKPYRAEDLARIVREVLDQ
ncbi:MAG: response regulator [Deltaproteobacteria bacterium]|nr:response regulator [Deltaproteobacteria bacterium]